MAKKAKEKKKKGIKHHLYVIAAELVIIIVLSGVLRLVVIPATSMGKVDLDNQELIDSMNAGVYNSEVLKNYRTFALFGVDSREGELSRATLSDVVIVAAINKNTGDVRLCSIYRDTFLNVGRVGGEDNYYTKCNAAYSHGGPAQAITMLNRNLDLNITDFVTIGFGGVADVIDALGGIEIDVQEDAVQHLNNYQLTMSAELGRDYTPVEHGGLQTLDGLQAVGYARVRYIASGDLARAEHQREIVEATLAKAKQASPLQLSEIANRIFPETYTSLDLTEILALVADVGKYNIGGQAGFPQMDHLAFGDIGSEGSCIVPYTLADNTIWLHQFLFEDSAYSPGAEVSAFSNEIMNRTAPYLQ